MLFEINDCDIGAFFCKGNGNRAANSAVAASNDRHLVLQFSAALMRFILRLGSRLHFMFATGSPSLMLTRLKFLFLGHSSPLSTQIAATSQRRRLRVRAAFFPATERDVAERRPAARFACRDSAFFEADRRLSRFSAALVARERFREGFL